MRFSCCQRHLQLLFITGAILTLIPCLSIADTVVLKNGKQKQGTVVGIQGKNLLIQVGAGKIGLPLRQIRSIDMPVPAQFAKAEAAYAKKDYPVALANVKPVVDKFKGLPLDWAKDALRMLGNTYMGLDKMDMAQETFLAFKKLYPGEAAAGGAEVSMAKLAVANKEFEKAKTKLQPLADAALGAESFSEKEGATYGQVFVLLGDIDLAEENFPSALENYLRTVTIFYHDEAVATEARQKVAALREAQPEIHVP